MCTYLVFESVLVIVLIVEVFEVIIILIEVLKLKGLAGEPINGMGDDLQGSI